MAESYGTYYVVMERYWDTSFDEPEWTEAGVPVGVIDSDRELAEQDARQRTLQDLANFDMELRPYFPSADWLSDEATQRIFELCPVAAWADLTYTWTEWREEGYPLPYERPAPAAFYEALADVLKDRWYYVVAVSIPAPRS